MKKFSLLAIVAAIAMVSCSNTYEGKSIELTNLNDSVNYALGLVNAHGIKMQQFRNIDSTEYNAATTAFMDGLVKGYEAKESQEPSEIQSVAQNIAYAVKDMEKSGLANNPAWAINEKLFLQGLVNGVNQEHFDWDPDSATAYFREQYQRSTAVEDADLKPIKAKCPSKPAKVTLKNDLDSINYAFGLLNGQQVVLYVLSADTTGTGKDEFLKELNHILKSGQKYPQLSKIGEQIGGQIKAQEATGLIGIDALTTDFELIKQGFINGFLDYGDWDSQMANMYIQEAINEVQYGPNKREGLAFLEEKGKEDGVITTESGLMYKVLREGKGPKPTREDKVKVNYEGRLINDTIFDSSYQRGEPIVFGVTQVIAGWTEALQLMPVGSMYELYIPYNLAYGERGAGASIPPYATLIFKVELLGIEK